MKKIFNHKYLFAIIYSLILIGFTIYLLLDTLVIPKAHIEVNVVATENYQQKKSEITDTLYIDENIQIEIKTYDTSSCTIYVADIVLNDAKYLKTAFARNIYGENILEKTSDTTKRNNGILSINGDYYGARENGYVLKNGISYRSIPNSWRECLALLPNGNFNIYKEREVSLAALEQMNVKEVLSFGPTLLKNNQIVINPNETQRFYATQHPRTAIGIIDELHYVFVVTSGRTTKKPGLTIPELAEFMQSLNVDIAYNLDGGGSSTMYFNGKVINNPSYNDDTIEEREVSDIVYIGY